MKKNKTSFCDLKTMMLLLLRKELMENLVEVTDFSFTRQTIEFFNNKDEKYYIIQIKYVEEEEKEYSITNFSTEKKETFESLEDLESFVGDLIN